MKNKMKKIIICLMLILIIVGTLFINKIKFKCSIEGAETKKAHPWKARCDDVGEKKKYGYNASMCSILRNAGSFDEPSDAGDAGGSTGGSPGGPVPDVSPPKEFPLAQTDTWDEASAKCNGEGKKLCTKDQICKNDEPVFYGKTADTWTPIAEKDDWLQIGTHDTRLCETHPGGPPGWGTVKTMKGFRNTLICCD